MHLKTIINSCCNFNGFVIKNSNFDEKRRWIDVEIRVKKNHQGTCSLCNQKGPNYDHLPTRKFEFIPIWGYAVYFNYSMRRIDCPTCGVKVESVPWGAGKNHLTDHYANFLASWAKEMSWSKVADRFNTSWQTVHRAVQSVVAFGLTNRRIDNVTAIGVDEVHYGKKLKYITMVYQINKGSRRLLWIGKKRTKKTLRRFFADMWKIDRKFRKRLEVVCTDMWQAYISVVKEKTNAINVLDRFHIMQKMGAAIDKVRNEEVKRLKAEGCDPILTKTKWCFLKRRFNLTRSQKGKLNGLVELNLTTMKAYILKELFHKFWEYKSTTWAARFLKNWCELVRESEIEPMIKICKMLERREELILNYFRAKKEYNSGIVEGMNRKVNLTTRKAFGYRSYDILETALFHQLGDLPEQQFDHKFW